MESDIILQGFQECEQLHGVRYLRLIGDGDSSVFANIIENGPSWCKRVQKFECSNHVVKNIRAKLEQLVSNNPYYKGSHRLTKVQRVGIVTAVRCSIRRRSNEVTIIGKAAAVKKLQNDIKNTCWHVFGHHTNCNPDFCNPSQCKILI